MTSFRQIIEDYHEKTGRYPSLNINPEILSQKATHFDKDKGVRVKIFKTTKSVDSITAEIMEGENKGMWTSCYLKNLEEIHE